MGSTIEDESAYLVEPILGDPLKGQPPLKLFDVSYENGQLVYHAYTLAGLRVLTAKYSSGNASRPAALEAVKALDLLVDDYLAPIPHDDALAILVAAYEWCGKNGVAQLPTVEFEEAP